MGRQTSASSSVEMENSSCTKPSEQDKSAAKKMRDFAAQQRFYEMLDARQEGDIETVGRIFRQDGVGLRDDYQISGPELEAMCEIARTVQGVLGERMLGGDKRAASAIARAESVDELRKAVDATYPQNHPQYAQKYAVHVCQAVDGVVVYDDLNNIS